MRRKFRKLRKEFGMGLLHDLRRFRAFRNPDVLRFFLWDPAVFVHFLPVAIDVALRKMRMSRRSAEPVRAPDFRSGFLQRRRGMKCLLVTRAFPPTVGGSATVYSNTCRCAAGALVVLAPSLDSETGRELAGWRECDRKAGCLVFRTPLLGRGRAIQGRVYGPCGCSGVRICPCCCASSGAWRRSSAVSASRWS